MEIKGKLVKIHPTKELPSGKKLREIWIETEEKYSQTIPVQIWGDKISLVDKMVINDSYVVSINLGGRVVGDRCYPSITGWKVEASASAPIEEEDNDLPCG
jgi:hypothetical protein